MKEVHSNGIDIIIHLCLLGYGDNKDSLEERVDHRQGWHTSCRVSWVVNSQQRVTESERLVLKVGDMTHAASDYKDISTGWQNHHNRLRDAPI